MFKKVHIKNFRVISDVIVDNLAQVNLIVGDNNCGKTTLLESILLLAGAPNPHLPVTVNSVRGIRFFNAQIWYTFFHDMRTESHVQIRGEILENQEQLSLVVEPLWSEPQIGLAEAGREGKATLENGEADSGVELNGLELVYVSSKEPGKQVKARVFLEDNKPKTEGSKATSLNGILLSAAGMYDWKNKFDIAQRNKQIPELVSVLREIDPEIADIRLNAVGMLEADIGLPHLLPFNLIGNGTIKFLNIALAMLDFRNGLVLIDEIDNGLYHSAQQILWKAIFSWAKRFNVQVFATTHSEECVRAFAECADGSLFKTDGKLLRLERKATKFRIVEYSQKELGESLENHLEVR